MLQLGCGGRLALGSWPGAARTGNDLERDLTLFSLVEGVPDRAHSAASQRLEQAVPAEDERRRGSMNGGLRHPRDRFSAGTRTPSVRKEWATVARIRCKQAL